MPAIFCLASLVVANAQNVGINDDNSTPDPSAMLDVKSNSKGMLVPRLTTSQRTGISNAANGLLVFDTDSESFWFNTTNGWQELVSNPVKTITDTDGDTKIQVEKSPDEDIIHFDLGGTEQWTMRDKRLEPQNTGNSVFIGNEVGNAGSNNVQIGHQAGKNATGSNNIFIGNDAGKDETGSNRLFVGPLLYGETDNNLLRVNGTLNIDNKYSLPSADGTAGQILQTDGNGNLAWVNSPVPAGTIMTWAGHIEDTGGLIELTAYGMPGYFLCNGAQINSSTYPNLFNAIGANWGNGGDSDPNTINIPDLRGAFLRGVNGGGSGDPDASYRANYSGGYYNGVGSFQLSATKQHTHEHAYPDDWYYITFLSGTQSPKQALSSIYPYDWATTGASGESYYETRPMNYAVNYIIKY